MPGEECEGLCHGPDDCKEKGKDSCPFLDTYYNQLKRLDFNSIMKRFEKLEATIKSTKNLEEDIDFVLIVYETPQNPCSERRVLQKWFEENGYELKEWSKE